MIKNLLSLLMALFFTGALFGQFTFSIGAGANLSILQDKISPTNPKGLVGISINGLMGFELSEKFKFNIGTDLITKGSKEFLNANLFANSFDLRSFNVEVIPQIEYKPIANLGIGIGIYVNAVLMEAGRTNQDSWNYSRQRNILNPFDLGAAVFIRGYLNNFYLQLGGQYGFSKIADIEFTDFNGQSLGAIGGANRSISFGAGIIL